MKERIDWSLHNNIVRSFYTTLMVGEEDQLTSEEVIHYNLLLNNINNNIISLEKLKNTAKERFIKK